MIAVHKYIAKSLPMLLLVMALAACGDDQGQHTLVNFDVSQSGMSSRSNLVNEARQTLAAVVTKMGAGDRATAVGFNFAPGTSCEPLVFTIASDANSEEVKSQRAANTAGLEAAFTGYVSCLTNGESGFAGTGSAVFGSITSAMSKANADEYPVNQIITVSDGCSVGEGAPTCKPEVLARQDVATTVIDSLPNELKPDLKGITLSWVGIGQGTSLQADQIARLSAIYTAFAQATNAASE